MWKIVTDRLKQPSTYLGIASFGVAIATGGLSAVGPALPGLLAALGLIVVNA